MLQDISPKKLNNQFADETPDAEAACIAIKDGGFLIRDEEPVDFPRFEELKDEIKRCVYLFSIDEQKYFLVELKSDAVQGFKIAPMTEFRNMKPKHQVFAGMTAHHLHVWYRDNQFCGRCGAKTVHSSEERMIHCDNCGNSIYPKIMPAVIVGVTNGDEILVTKYRGRVYKRYALVAGFTEIGETAEETVAREVFEETGIRVKNVTYYKSQPWGVAQDLLLGYFCELDGDDAITMDENELSVAEWIHRDDLEVSFEDVSMTNEMLCMFKYGEDFRSARSRKR